MIDVRDNGHIAEAHENTLIARNDVGRAHSAICAVRQGGLYWPYDETDMNQNGALARQITASTELNEFICEVIGEPDLPPSDRAMLAGRSYCLALELARGILILAHYTNHSSATALCRCADEALVAGMWFQIALTDNQIEQYLHKPFKKNHERMMQEIAKQVGKDSAATFPAWSKNKNALHDYAHAGTLAISRMGSENSIEPIHDEEEIIEILKYSSHIALRSALGVMILAEDDQAQQQLNSKLNELCQNCET
jgi:hypothetical protein